MGDDLRQTLQNIKDAPWLLKPHVHMKNTEKVIEKVNRIIQDGRDKLQVIFDFDRTLTKYHDNGVVTKSSFCVLESLPVVPESAQERLKANYNKYLPIEIDPKLTVEEKIPHMNEWWLSGIEILKGIEWNPKSIDEYLRHQQQPFRDGTTEVFRRLCSAGIPVLVFSAGIGDVVKRFLQYQGYLTSNVHIVSNFLTVEDGKISGCVDDIIHVFNKNELVVQKSPYFKELTGRGNVILLGDSEGDAKMADGVPHDTVLKIGFLNTHIEHSLPQYEDLFDIVLTDDQTMDVLIHILQLML